MFTVRFSNLKELLPNNRLRIILPHPQRGKQNAAAWWSATRNSK